MRHTIKAITAATLLAASTIAVSGVETATDANDVILAGHDTVAYFTENKPVVGSERYTAQHDGAVYRFASAANRDQFRANPAKYAPAYGGYCAFGASLGKKFDVDGKAFKIVEGRLYVNKNLDVLQTWKKDIPGNILKAEGQWLQIGEVAPGDL
ncbi:MAG: YHS domain-containing protein [Chromatiales bacterium]|nr:YHS domain-containing protein [Chromatiales bacterium]